ncbi:MAG TPA: alpha/beta fold hydrolase [Casimicrobiaceae bacterium]
MALFVLEHAGTRPPVVCLHGFCQSSDYWAPTLDRLHAHGVDALAPDLPGFARSASEPGPYTIADMADAIVRLLDARGIDVIRLVGGSMGGVVAQQLALRHPQRVERLLLVATGAVMGDPAAGLAKADAIAAAPWDEATVAPIVDGFFHRRPSEREIASLRGIALSASHRAAIDAARSNAQTNTLSRLSEIRVPTLIVQGRHDRARTPEHGALMRERIAGAWLAVIEDAGHTPQLEQPEAFHDVALPFLLAPEVARVAAA